MIEGVLGATGKTVGLIMSPILAFIGYIGWSVRRAHTRIDQQMTKEEVRQLLDDKLETLKVQHIGFIHRISTLEQKIDRLIELHMKKPK